MSYVTRHLSPSHLTYVYFAEFSGILVDSNVLVCKVVGREVLMSISTLSLPSSPSIVELEGGVLRRNGIESEYLRWREPLL